MNRYAAALSQHPVHGEAVGEVAGAILEGLDGERPDLLVWFATPPLAEGFAACATGLKRLLEPATMAGAVTAGVAGGSREVDDRPALAAFAARFVPSARLGALALDSAPDDGGVTISGWPDGVPARGTLLLLADPATFPVTDFLRLVNASVPGLRVVGGQLPAAGADGRRLALGRRVLGGGAVGILLGDEVPVVPVVSQGCRPLGRPLIVTGARRNAVVELAGRPPLQRLRDLALDAVDGSGDGAPLGPGVKVGVAVDEHRVEFGRGDFLVREVLGIDPGSGALLLAGRIEVGQTVQFLLRDAAAADEDLNALLAGVDAAGALLFSCSGRGRRLFGGRGHDAALAGERLGGVPLAGALCAGEIGPIAGRSFLHGASASLAVFTA